MIDQCDVLNSLEKDGKLSSEMKSFLNKTKDKLPSCERRKFMAEVVRLMGKGGQRRAEKELGWNRKLITKGANELNSGFDCVDNFSG